MLRTFNAFNLMFDDKPMRFLLSIMLIGLLGFSVRAQSLLPDCPSGLANKHNCFGSFTFLNGTSYLGEFKNGNRHGQGRMTYPNGDQLIGDFTEGFVNGKAILIYGNGGKYIGEFKNNRLHGQGTLMFANGDELIGNFKESSIDGWGTLNFTNGNKYVGEFKGNLLNGRGTLTYANGDKLTGEFKDGFINGQATLTYASGRRYVGEWKLGKRDGEGIEYKADGTVAQTGIWDEDKLINYIVLDRTRFPFDLSAQTGASSSMSLLNALNSSKISQKNNNAQSFYTLNDAQIKCKDLGFKQKTEGFGRCVLQLSKQ